MDKKKQQKSFPLHYELRYHLVFHASLVLYFPCIHTMCMRMHVCVVCAATRMKNSLFFMLLKCNYSHTQNILYIYVDIMCA